MIFGQKEEEICVDHVRDGPLKPEQEIRLVTEVMMMVMTSFGLQRV
jgi:hypothetical protein